MLTIGDKLPDFKLKAVVSRDKGKEFKDITNSGFSGKWLVLFFWPKDFTFVCPTEIAEFGRRAKDFAERNAQVLGVSTDSEFVHLAWRNNHTDLKDLSFPMLADIKRELSTQLGVLHKEEGVALRATFIIDPQGIIRWVSVNDLSVGRSVPEVLRVLDGLQTDELCPCNWEKGQPTLQGLAMDTLEALREAMPEAARDIKLNLQSVLESGSLNPAQRWGVAVASAIASRNDQMREALVRAAQQVITEEVIDDARAAAILMGMNNIFYRFRHMVNKESYIHLPVRLRMNRMGQLKGNKADFELFCLAVSAINGCETCIRSHEEAVVRGGLTEENIHDAVRIASTVYAASIAASL